MSEVEFRRTRQSIGSQLRETLDTMRERGEIEGWELIASAPHGFLSYYVQWVDGFDVRVSRMTPGEAIDWVNERGYDVRFGKS